MVLSLRAELQKAQDEAQVAKEAAKAVEIAAYEREVLKTESRLAEEIAKVCRDYWTVTWTEAFNSTGVPANFELRRAENVFFPKHIREVPADPPSTALLLPPPEQASSVPNPILNAKALLGAGKGKEDLPPASDAQFEDILTLKEVVSQAKVAKKLEIRGAKSKAADTKDDPQLIKK